MLCIEVVVDNGEARWEMRGDNASEMETSRLIIDNSAVPVGKPPHVVSVVRLLLVHVCFFFYVAIQVML